MYGQFVREIPEEIDKDLSWKRLVQNDLEEQTEAMICAAQEQVLRTNHTRNKIDKTLANPLCRIYGERGETVQHIIRERKNLAQRECKRRPDTIAKLVHWKLREKHNLEGKEEWYEHCPDRVVGDDDVELIWDINIQCYGGKGTRLNFGGKRTKSWAIIDVAVPGDCRKREKEI